MMTRTCSIYCLKEVGAAQTRLAIFIQNHVLYSHNIDIKNSLKKKLNFRCVIFHEGMTIILIR